MSFFDQPYYGLAKVLMSRIGIWPDQSKYVRIMLHLTVFAIIVTLTGPALIRLRVAWRDIGVLTRTITICLLTTGIVFIMIVHHFQNVDMVRLLFKKIEEHWGMLENTPAVMVLNRYAEHGRYFIVVYSTCTFGAMILFFTLCLSPTILDIVNPLNETRPKIYIIEVEYGVDADKYYWCIIAHTYIAAGTAGIMIVGFTTMYILVVVHACALFEVVGFNLELMANKYSVNRENAITLRIDCDYKKITDCIILHTEAIRFADTIEDVASKPSGMILAVAAIITIMSGVQAVAKWDHPEVLIQQTTLIIGQLLHLFMVNVPGQELINRSGKIHTIAYNLEWYGMTMSAQKLLIPILVRSNKPCCFTAGKVFVLSMETFSSEIRIMMSYFIMFAQMI